jgi:hypothetical protein
VAGARGGEEGRATWQQGVVRREGSTCVVSSLEADGMVWAWAWYGMGWHGDGMLWAWAWYGMGWYGMVQYGMGWAAERYTCHAPEKT